MYGSRSINYQIVKAVFSSSLSFFLSLSSKFPVSSFFSPVYVPPYSSYVFHLSTTPPIWKVLKVHCPIIQIFNEGIKQYFFPSTKPQGCPLIHNYQLDFVSLNITLWSRHFFTSFIIHSCIPYFLHLTVSLPWEIVPKALLWWQTTPTALPLSPHHRK